MSIERTYSESDGGGEHIHSLKMIDMNTPLEQVDVPKRIEMIQEMLVDPDTKFTQAEESKLESYLQQLQEWQNEHGNDQQPNLREAA